MLVALVYHGAPALVNEAPDADGGHAAPDGPVGEDVYLQVVPAGLPEEVGSARPADPGPDDGHSGAWEVLRWFNRLLLLAEPSNDGDPAQHYSCCLHSLRVLAGSGLKVHYKKNNKNMNGARADKLTNFFHLLRKPLRDELS